MSSAESVTPAGAAILVFAIGFTLLGIFIVPPLINGNLPRMVRPICVVALICSIIVCAFLASFAALHGTADQRPTSDGRLYAVDHGKRTELSAFAHRISSILEVGFGLAAPILGVCLFAISSIKRNAAQRGPG